MTQAEIWAFTDIDDAQAVELGQSSTWESLNDDDLFLVVFSDGSRAIYHPQYEIVLREEAPL